MSQAPRVLMIGPGEHMPGGMSAVIQTYRAAGLFDSGAVRYVSSYGGPGPCIQLRSFGAAMLHLLGALLGGRCDLLHVHSASRGSFWRKSVLAAMARAFGKPYVFHLHSGEFSEFYAGLKPRWARAWVRHTLRSAAAVLALTPSWLAALRRIEPQARLRVALNPVQTTGSPPHPARPARRILFLGRIREKKGAFDLLRAFSAVRRSVPDAFLQLAGDGELAQAAQLADHLELPANSYELSGWIDGAAKQHAMDSADVFVLPSYFEGLPIGILEAMAAGVPVVASAVGGVPDLVAHERSGLLMQAGDVDTLARHIEALLKDDGLRNRLIAGGHEAVMRHAADRVVGELSALYVDLRS